MLPKSGPPQGEVAVHRDDLADHRRRRLKELAGRFLPDASWMELARLLIEVRRARLHTSWGYRSFKHYHEAELGLGKTTVYDVVAAHEFVARLRAAGSIPSDGVLPNYNTVVMLARAEPRVPDFPDLLAAVFAGRAGREDVRRASRRATPEPAPRGAADAYGRDDEIRRLRALIAQLRGQLLGASRLGRDFDLRWLRRGLAFQCHPDRGGDEALMKDVNRLFDLLESITQEAAKA